jgi:hypothetical protein
MELVLTLLALHGLLGGLDVALNHERAERLPHRPGAAMGEALHAAREALFAALFLGLAWCEWHGWQCLALTALGLAAIAWCVRDALSSRRLRQAPAPAAATATR